MTTKSVTLTEWTTAGGVVYPPGDHELDADTAELLASAQEREDARVEAARKAADEELDSSPTRQTMIGVHDYIGPVVRPDLLDPVAAVHPNAAKRVQVTDEARQTAFDLRVDNAPTPATPQSGNTAEQAPARSSSTTAPVAAKPAVPTGTSAKTVKASEDK
jgi:hypothetical protein